MPTPPAPILPLLSATTHLFTPTSTPLPPTAYTTTLAVLVLLIGGFFLLRRIDVRLVLILCAFALFAAVGRIPDFFTKFAYEFTNPSFIVPICSAWGFASVLKLTECDSHLVHLLLRPLRHARWVLIPGGIAAGFFVNTIVVSQTGTASLIGPLLIPLLLAARVPPVTAGAVLLMGSSMGGELCNPAAVELNALAPLIHLSPQETVQKVLPANLLACAAATLVFWLFAALTRRPADADTIFPAVTMAAPTVTARDIAADAPFSAAAATPQENTVAPPPPPQRINLIKALVPVLPLALLFIYPHTTFTFPTTPAAAALRADTIAIGAAMLLGTVAAGLTSPRRFGHIFATFSDGAGRAFTHVITLIVAATSFADAIIATGLMQRLTNALSHAPAAMNVAAIAVTWVMATVTGTGLGTGPPIIRILIPVAQNIGLSPLRTGTLIAIAAQFGRTTSPVAPVVLLCAALAGAPPLEVLKRVFPPLLAGGIVLAIAAIFHWI